MQNFRKPPRVLIIALEHQSGNLRPTSYILSRKLQENLTLVLHRAFTSLQAN